MKKATNPRAPKSASAKAAMVSGQTRGVEKMASLRAERKIAAIKDQIRVLMAAPRPGVPVPPSTDEDTPLAEMTRKRV